MESNRMGWVGWLDQACPYQINTNAERKTWTRPERYEQVNIKQKGEEERVESV
jgi:hypothetical protein